MHTKEMGSLQIKQTEKAFGYLIILKLQWVELGVAPNTKMPAVWWFSMQQKIQRTTKGKQFKHFIKTKFQWYTIKLMSWWSMLENNHTDKPSQILTRSHIRLRQTPQVMITTTFNAHTALDSMLLELDVKAMWEFSN